MYHKVSRSLANPHSIRYSSFQVTATGPYDIPCDYATLAEAAQILFNRTQIPGYVYVSL